MNARLRFVGCKNIPQLFLMLTVWVIGFGAQGAARADSIELANLYTQFSGVQGQSGWYYGSIPETPNYDPTRDFNLLPRYGAFVRNGGRVSWYLSDDNWVHVERGLMHPNVVGYGPQTFPGRRWAAQRWRSTLKGSIRITGTAQAAVSHPAGYGPTFTLFIDGRIKYTADLQDASTRPYQVIDNVEIGSSVDFVVKARGSNEASDSTYVRAAITNHPSPDVREIAPFGAQWTWLHPLDGTDPETSMPGFQNNWMKANSPNFANFGAGPLGYGAFDLTPLVTNIGTPPAGQRYTAYFRRSFTLPATITGNFFANLICDDGAVIYIDGQRVGHFNHPAADAYKSLAPETADEFRTQCVPLSTTFLNAGTHLLAVSVHNNANGSSDLAFDLELKTFSTPTDLAITTPPVVADNEFSPGDEFSVDVEVSNLSSVTSSSTSLKVSGGALEATASVPSILAGEKRTLRVPLTIPTSQPDSYIWLRAEVDPESLVADSNRANNRASIKLIHVLKPLPQKIHLNFDDDAPFAVDGKIIRIGFGWSTPSAQIPNRDGIMPVRNPNGVYEPHPYRYRDYMKELVGEIFHRSGFTNFIWVDEGGEDVASVYFCGHASIYGMTNSFFVDQRNKKRKAECIVFSDFWQSEQNTSVKTDAETAAHELGHAMGLRHIASQLQNQVMRAGSCGNCELPQFANEVGDIDLSLFTGDHNPKYHLLRFSEGWSDKKLRAEGIVPGSYDEFESPSHSLGSSGTQTLARIKIFVKSPSDDVAFELFSGQGVSLNEALNSLGNIPNSAQIKIEGSYVSNNGSLHLVNSATNLESEFVNVGILGQFFVQSIDANAGNSVVGSLHSEPAAVQCEFRSDADGTLRVLFRGKLQTSQNLMDWQDMSSAREETGDIHLEIFPDEQIRFFRAIDN